MGPAVPKLGVGRVGPWCPDGPVLDWRSFNGMTVMETLEPGTSISRLKPTRRRLQLESVSAVFFLAAAMVTAVWPDWIEAVFHVDPDHGNGSLEWVIVAVLGVAAVYTAALAWRDYRRVLAG